MQRLVNFFLKNRTLILFLVLLSISLSLTVNHNDYHKSKFFNSSSYITGSIHNFFSLIGDYFGLKKENNILLKENNRLKLLELNQTFDTTKSEKYDMYTLKSANVIKNSYSLSQNYLTLNVGKKDSIKEESGVITSNGIVGIIDKTSAKYSRVISILNTKIKINAKLKKTNHFGNLQWNGIDPDIVQLLDIQDLVKLNIGDTIVTSGFSSIFPENILVGTIKSFQLNETKDLYNINLKLFNDMTNLRHVYIVENRNIKELNKLNQTE